MLIIRKNKILTLLIASFCVFSYAELTIPVLEAYNQLTTTIDNSTSAPTWFIYPWHLIQGSETILTIYLMVAPDRNQPYKDITIPQNPTPLQLILDGEVNLTAAVATPTGGYIAFIEEATKAVWVATISYDGQTLTASPVQQISNSSATGTGIAMCWDPEGQTLVMWNRETTNDPNNYVSQVAQLNSLGNPSAATNCFLQSAFTNLGIAEVPRAAYLANTTKWILAQNGYKNNTTVGSVYGTYDSVSGFSSSGSIPNIEGKPTMTLELATLDSSHVVFSTANRPNYSSSSHTGQLLTNNGALSQLGSSFSTKSVYQRLSKNAGNTVHLLTMDQSSSFHIHTVSSSSVSEETLLASQKSFWSTFNQTYTSTSDALTYKRSSDGTTSHWILLAASTDIPSPTYSKIAANLSSGAQTIKTHSRRAPNQAFTTKLVGLATTTSPQDMQKYLNDKYTPLTKSSQTTNSGQTSRLQQNKVFSYQSTSQSSTMSYEIHQQICNGVALKGFHMKSNTSSPNWYISMLNHSPNSECAWNKFKELKKDPNYTTYSNYQLARLAIAYCIYGDLP
jgi:hypothetical protein